MDTQLPEKNIKEIVLGSSWKILNSIGGRRTFARWWCIYLETQLKTEAMLTLDCLFAGCKEQVMDKYEPVAVVMLEAHRMIHKVTDRSATAARPRITQGMSIDSWRSFQVMWRLYKTDTDVSEEECGLQLIQCCEGKLLERLFRADHRIFSKPEGEQMESIGKLVVASHDKVRKCRQKATCEIKHGKKTL